MIGAAGAAIASVLWFSNILAPFEAVTWDLRVRLMPTPAEANDKIRLIFIDQTSLDWGADENDLPWPWMREVYTYMLAFCERGGAQAVVFDIVYPEPSRAGPLDDAAFGAAIARTKNFVCALDLNKKQGSDRTWPATAMFQPSGIEPNALSPSIMNAIDMPRASFPVDAVLTNAPFLGVVWATQDDDAVIRRTMPLFNFDGRMVPSLGLAAFLAINPDIKPELKKNSLILGDTVVSLDDEGRVILNYRGPSQTHTTVSAQSVLQSEIRIREGGSPVLDPAIFKDKIVFLGVTAPTLMDLKPTPLSRTYPGVELHATLLDNLLTNDAIKNTPTPLTIAVMIFLAILAGVACRAASDWKQAAVTAALVLASPIVMGCIAYSSGIWLPIIPPLLSAATAVTIALYVNYATEGRQKRFIKNAFQQYLSPVVIDKLLKDPSRLKLGGETRELSIFFSDVQGFTSISECLTPEELTALLNDYLSAMTDIIHSEGGTIDKYEGDAIIAFWNAPVELEGHAKNAVRAALRCQQKLTELRPEFKERVGKELYARIGINTGTVVVGNMGSHQRFDYTFLGDAGNLAARLEGINKQFGTYLMISENTRNLLSDEFSARELSRVRVVGRKEAVRVFEPFFKDQAPANMEETPFARALKLYYDGSFEAALELFMENAETDPPSQSYARRCRKLIEKPPDKWDGIWEMTEK
jgi:adenylate cyclase